MDPRDPLAALRGRADRAILAALLVPLSIVGFLLPARSKSPAGARAPATPAASVTSERGAEPPTALRVPPSAAARRAVPRNRAVQPAAHRSKSDAFDGAAERALAAQAAARERAAPRLARLELALRDGATGAPLPGAVAEIANGPNGQGGNGPRDHRADARGIVSVLLEPGPSSIVAWSAGATAGPLEVELAPGESRSLQLDLLPAAAVVGRVVDARTGRAIAGASVAFWTHAELDRVRTDADGRFLHPRFPAHAPEQQVRVEALGYAPAVRYLELGAGGAWAHRAAHAGEHDVLGAGLPARVDVALQPELALAGRVLDPRGRPATGARVEAVGYALLLPDVATRDCAACETDADGRFRLAGLRPDVSHALQVRAADCAELVIEVPAPPSSWVHDPSTLALGDLALDEPALLAGVVLDAAGEPLADAEVRLARLDRAGPAPATPADPGARPSLASRIARTDEGGAFAFPDLAPGRYELRARRDRGTLAAQELELARAEHRADVQLVPGAPTWTLRGVLTTPTGPLAGAALAVERFGTVAHLRTDAAGRFALAGLDDVATYTIRAQEPGYTPAEVTAHAWEHVALEVAPKIGPAMARR
jgi:protocatechuate 3,4-dioxygenase beta subunit